MLLSHYELVEHLGSGGMGHVYRALHRPSGRAVAVKMLHPEAAADPRHRRLFLDEATAAAKIDDPRVVRLLDLGRANDERPFLVMELASGAPLEGLLSTWPGWPVMQRALEGVLRGLASAHAAGVVHRDLKPANILVDPDGEARILDFGVAALVDPLRRELRDDVVGTPEYMPPEQMLGTGPFGPWSDLYAFGVVLARVLFSESPFARHDNVMQMLVAKAHYAGRPVPPPRPGLTVPDELHALIERLLRPHPRDRPRFAIEVATELAALGPRVVDLLAPRASAPPEAPDSSQHTLVDSVATAPEVPPAAGPLLSLPTRLPAPADLTVGAALSRLREVSLVGRDAETRELEVAVDEVVSDGRPRLVVYVGEAGIGKSRLARWGLAHVEKSGLMEGAGGGYDASGANVAGGLRHALSRLVSLPPNGWEESWKWFEGEPELDVDQLRGLLRASPDAIAPSVEAVVAMTHATLRRIGRERPIYLWLDDLGWARDGGLELVERLLDTGDVPILVVATMRLGTTQHTGVQRRIDLLLEHSATRVRRLRALDRDARVSLLAQRAPLGPGIAEAIADRVEGSPLLLVQLVEDWLERGLLVPAGPVMRPRGGASVDDLLRERPLAALLDDRVDGLLGAFGDAAGTALDVLARAAFLGQRFEQTTLRAACSRDPAIAAALDEVLDRALLLGALRSEGDGFYAFDHALLRDGLVERAELAPGWTSALIDAANGLQARYGKERPDVAAVVAELLHRAGDVERAWERQLHATQRAAWSGNDLIAQSYLAVSLAWADGDPMREAHAARLAARVHYFALRYDAALTQLARARELAAGLDDHAFILSCDAAEADTLFYLDRFREAEEIAARCVSAPDDTSESLDEADARGNAAHRLADLAVLRGDHETALAWRQRTVELTRRTARPWRVRIAKLNLSEILAVLGRTGEALAIAEAMLEEAKADRDTDGADAARENVVKIGVLSGRAQPEHAAYLEERIAAMRAADAWRLSSLLVCRALLSVVFGIDDGEIVAHWTKALVEAYRAVPHDEAFSLEGLRRLAVALEARGSFELAREIEGLIADREARYRAGFAEG